MEGNITDRRHLQPHLQPDIHDIVEVSYWLNDDGDPLNREAPEELRPELTARAKQLIEESGFRCFPALCALEAKPAVEWDKGRAAVYILRTAFGVDWNERVRIIFAGDDVGDEDAIVALKGHPTTTTTTTNPADWIRSYLNLI